MGQFDDLIPGNKKPSGARVAGAFADLLPTSPPDFSDVKSSANSTEQAAPRSFMDELTANTDYAQQIAANRARRQQQDQSGQTNAMLAANRRRQFNELAAPVRALVGAGSRVNSLVQGGA